MDQRKRAQRKSQLGRVSWRPEDQYEEAGKGGSAGDKQTTGRRQEMESQLKTMI